MQNLKFLYVYNKAVREVFCESDLNNYEHFIQGKNYPLCVDLKLHNIQQHFILTYIVIWQKKNLFCNFSIYF